MKLKVMSFNLRCAVKVDGINYFFNRADRVKQVIIDESPDVIGFQEVTDPMRVWLRDNIGDRYEVIGCGRELNYRGESCTIAYKKNVFELLSFDTKALSATPHIIGTRYEDVGQSVCPRIYSRATLTHEDLPKPFHFFNTHLDFMSEMPRTLGMAQILEAMTQCDGVKILTGDMNAKPDELAAQMPTSLKAETLTEATAGITHTFHNYGQITEGYKIDYIYTNADVCESYARDDGPVDGIWISDHYPVVAILEI